MFDSDILGIFNKKLSVYEECFIVRDKNELLDQLISFQDLFTKHNKTDELVPFIRFPEEYDLYLIGYVFPTNFEDTCSPKHDYLGCLDSLLDERRKENESTNKK